MISFYKAKPDSNGMSASFQAKGTDDCLYCTMLRQASWNPQNKTGSFIQNKNNPAHDVTIKFGFHELAGMIDAFQRNVNFTYFHSSPSKGSVRGNFRSYEKDGKTLGWVFSADKDAQGVKAKFNLGLTFAEVEHLLIYFRAVMTTFYVKKVEAYAAYKNQETPDSGPTRPNTEAAPEPANPVEDDFATTPSQPAQEQEAASSNDDW